MSQVAIKIEDSQKSRETISQAYTSQQRDPAWKGAQIKPTLGVLALGLTLWFIPTPEGLTAQTWHLFAIFATTIVAIIARPLPMAAISLISLTLCVMTKTLTLSQSLSMFNSPVVWLIVLAFLIARGFVKTGLGERVAYFFIANFGKRTLGLSYSLVTTELFLAPAVPSNTARGGGIIFPVIRALAEEFGSDPATGTAKKIGAYLIAVCFHSNLITSAMFLTAMACNPLIAILGNDAGMNLNWFSWAKFMSVPGIVSLLTTPFLLYRIFPPEVKETPDAPEKAREALRKRGKLTLDELIMLGTFGLLLSFWIFGESIGIDATTTALIGFSILLLTGVLSWQDVLNEKGAWETLIWFAILLMMASMLNELGMTRWFAEQVSGVVSDLSWQMTLIALTLVYFYIHYFFASVTAHVMAFFGAFLVLMIASSAPLQLGVLALAAASCLSGCLTHFGTGSAPVYYGAHYIKVRDWWRISFIVSLAHILVWGIVGGLWWKLLGLW